jgi:hypothetical protein
VAAAFSGREPDGRGADGRRTLGSGRRAGGELYQIHHTLVEAADRDEVHGVPVVSPALAIRQAIDWGVAGDMIEQAIRRAQAREHIGTQTAADSSSASTTARCPTTTIEAAMPLTVGSATWQ